MKFGWDSTSALINKDLNGAQEHKEYREFYLNQFK